MTTETRSELVAEDLGDDALAAYKNRTNWVYEPETCDPGDSWAYQCDDSDCSRLWHKQHLVRGYRISQGRVFEVIHVCDEDYDWDEYDSYDVDSPGYEMWTHQFSERKRQDGWALYAEWVKVTGEDPLDNYIVATTTKEAWTAKIVQEDGVLRFDGTHRKSIAYVDRAAIKDVSALPITVRSFLCLDDEGVVQGLTSLDQLRCDDYKIEQHGDVALITFDVSQPLHPDIVRENRRRAAERHLEEVEEDA